MMKMSGAAADSFLRRHQMLSLCFWITLLFSILFAMAAMDVVGQCYCDPCSSSSPAITSGLSTVTAIAAFIFISQPCYGLYLLRIQSSELVTGVFIGCSGIATIWAFNEAVLWASEASLAEAIALETSLEENSSGVMSFKALSILAWILFALQLFSTYTSCTSRDVLLEVSWIATHDYSQLPTQPGVSTRKEGDFSTYQTMDDEDIEAAANGGEPTASMAHYL